MKNVLITGGAGYLGRAYLRWARQYRPDLEFTIFSRDEGKHARCRREFPECRYIIGDIRDERCLDLAIAGHDTVIHAAAFKYVPQGETNVRECHEINVLGSMNVAEAAARMGVKQVIGISTDKACSPINVYGMTKLLMERMFQEYNDRTGTQFNLVRYGNVVSSTGSVVPVFKNQLKAQGYITLTDPQMTRFWLTVEQAVNLINLALAEEKGGTVLIPRLPSMSMQGLADIAVMQWMEERDIKRAKCHAPDDEEFVASAIKIIGNRFGEKRHESLINDIEAQYAEADGGLNDWPIFRLYPTYKTFAGNKLGLGYSADQARKLMPDEMLKMIAEAPE